jgi:hypothetical protein
MEGALEGVAPIPCNAQIEPMLMMAPLKTGRPRLCRRARHQLHRRITCKEIFEQRHVAELAACEA